MKYQIKTSPIISNRMDETLMNNLLDFVKDSTKHFDESHDLEHAKKVCENAIRIAQCEQNVDYNTLITVAMLHDVCDHKYGDISIGEESLRKFIDSLGLNTTMILKLIENISWSNQNTKGYKKPNDVDTLILDIVRDADRIEALGETGLKRCWDYTKMCYPSLSDEEVNVLVAKHCREKLCRLYPEHFIVTRKGREIAQPLHEAVVRFLNTSVY